ncbi:hypothetical protein MC885_006861 [Smutsia gigantea]|nr:hypothetical protein MC885_006861 [Smutsia gigantea]
MLGGIKDAGPCGPGPYEPSQSPQGASISGRLVSPGHTASIQGADRGREAHFPLTPDPRFLPRDTVLQLWALVTPHPRIAMWAHLTLGLCAPLGWASLTASCHITCPPLSPALLPLKVNPTAVPFSARIQE